MHEINDHFLFIPCRSHPHGEQLQKSAETVQSRRLSGSLPYAENIAESMQNWSQAT